MPDAEVNIPLRMGIEAIDGPTVLYILYSIWQVRKIRSFCLKTLPKMTPVLLKVYIAYIYQTPLQCLSSYGCAISTVYCAMSS